MVEIAAATNLIHLASDYMIFSCPLIGRSDYIENTNHMHRIMVWDLDWFSKIQFYPKIDSQSLHTAILHPQDPN